MLPRTVTGYHFELFLSSAIGSPCDEAPPGFRLPLAFQLVVFHLHRPPFVSIYCFKYFCLFRSDWLTLPTWKFVCPRRSRWTVFLLQVNVPKSSFVPTSFPPLTSDGPSHVHMGCTLSLFDLCFLQQQQPQRLRPLRSAGARTRRARAAATRCSCKSATWSRGRRRTSSRRRLGRRAITGKRSRKCKRPWMPRKQRAPEWMSVSASLLLIDPCDDD